MRFGAWSHGCWVQICDWYTKGKIHVDIQGFESGAALGNPAREISFIMPKKHYKKLVENIDAAVLGIMYADSSVTDALGKFRIDGLENSLIWERRNGELLNNSE